RVVDAPRLIKAISYDEMQELAAHGARVLNAQAVEFARKAGIAIYARATAQPPALEGGTRVGAPTGERGAVGVAGLRDVTRVRGRGLELVAALGRERVPLVRLGCDGDVATALFVRDDLPDWPAVRARLGDAAVSVEEDLAAASVVGEGIGGDPTCLLRAL